MSGINRFPSADELPLHCVDFNHLGNWYNGAFVGADNSDEGIVDHIIDYKSGEEIFNRGIWSDSVVVETREAILQALLIARDKIDKKTRISN